MITIKKTLEEIRDNFSKEGYTLISSEYINSNHKLEYVCPNNHKHALSWNKWQCGRRCPSCFGNKKLTFTFVRENIEKEGYTVLSTEYYNNNTKLDLICSNNHIIKKSWRSWNEGKRCIECLKKEYLDVKQSFIDEGYILLSNNYINAFEKLEYICPKEHQHSISWNNWQHGYRCPSCYGNIKYEFDFVKTSFEKEGYVLLSDKYIDANSKLYFVCPAGHKLSTTWSIWTHGGRCAVCGVGSSKEEREILEFLNQTIPNIEAHNRTLISPLELDIVIPEKNYAVEYCGLYWHSESNGKDKNYHLNKLNKCFGKGLNLITIFEDEWLNKKEIVRSRLLQILNTTTTNKIYARDCSILEIDPPLKNIFLEKFHIQGKDNSVISLGAYINNILVSVMTFANPNIAKGRGSFILGTYELSRFCSDYNFRVVGIASKLLSHFIKKYNPKTVYSYADKRWSSGNLYNKLGFERLYDTAPNYWYIVGNKRLHRFNFRKSLLKNKLDYFDESLTEWENMKNNGFNRIWDCGSIKFELNF